MNQTTEYTIQSFTLDSYPLMKELFLSAYGLHMDHESFIKRYDTKTLGHGVIGFIAIHQPTHTAAAYYGVFPVTLLVDGQQVLAAQSGDTMTHENHRRKGLFVQLAKMTLEECRKQEVKLVFGQPNANSRHGFIHSLKFSHVDNIVRYDFKRRIKIPPFPKWMQKSGRFPLYLKYARKILKPCMISQVDEFINPLPVTSGKIWRNKSYLLYKAGESKFFLRFNQVLAWVKLSEVFTIGDLSNYSALDEDTLELIKKTATRLGYNSISFYLNKSFDMPSFLEKFEIKGSEPSCFYYIDENYTGLNLVLTAADFDTW